MVVESPSSVCEAEVRNGGRMERGGCGLIALAFLKFL
jgi:hypothetical protein